MKKTLLAIMVFVFCIASAQAENSQNPGVFTAYSNQSGANILAQLMNHTGNQQGTTVGKFIKADGNKLETLTAALLVASSGEEALPGDKPADSSSSGHEEDIPGDAAADSSSSGHSKDKGKKHSEPVTLGSGSSASP